jgi:hypothetical protein
VLAAADAEDCLAFMPDLQTWRTSIEDAATSWGYRVRGGGSASQGESVIIKFPSPL